MVAVIGFTCLASFASAELRTFTNKEGKSIKAEITGVASGKVSLKTENGKSYTFAFDTLSEADQTYIKEWYEKNKNNAKASDFRLDIEKKKERIRLPREKEKNSKTNSSKSTMYDVTYHFKLGYNKSTPTENISVKYFILKRTTTRGDEAIDPVIELITGTETIETLTSKEAKEWESQAISCESSSTKSKKGSSSKKETVLGVLAIVYANDKELFREHNPGNFEKDFKKYEEENPGAADAPVVKKKAAKKKKKKKAPVKKEDDKKAEDK